MALNPSITVKVDANTKQMLAEILAASRAANAILSSIDVSFNDFYDKKKSDKEAKEGGEDANKNWYDGWNKSSKKEGNKSRSRFARELTKWGAIVGAFGETIGVALYGAGGALVSVGSSLISAASAAAAFVPIGFALAGSFLAVKIAMSGLDDTFEAIGSGITDFITDGKLSGDTLEAFAESIEDLSPAAQVFAVNMLSLAGGFAMLRVAVQEGFFSGFNEELKELADTQLPGITTALRDIAIVTGESFGALFDAVNEFDIGAIMEGWVPILSSVLGALAPLATALLSFLITAQPYALALADQFGAWAQSLADFATSEEGITAIQGALQRALESLQSWMDLIGAAGKLLGSVLKLASAEGDGLIDSLTGILNNWNDILNTDTGADAFTQFLENGTRLIKALAPVLEGLKEAFKVLVTEDSIARFEDLAEGVGEVLPLLAELLGVFSSIGLLNTFVDLLVRVGEALPMETLGEFAELLGGVLQRTLIRLGPLFDALGEVIAILAETFGVLFLELEKSGVIQDLVDGLVPLIELVGELLVVFTPFLVFVIQMTAGLLSFAAALIGPLAEALSGLLEFVTPAIKMFDELNNTLLGGLQEAGNVVLFILNGIGEGFNELVEMVRGDVIPIWEAVIVAWDAFATFATDLFTNMWTAIVAIWDEFFGGVFGGVQQFVEDIIGVFQSLYDILVGNSIIPDMINAIIEWFSFLEPIIGFIQGFVDAIVGFFQSMYDRIVSIMASIRSTVTTVWNGIKSAVTTAVNTLKSTVSTVFNTMKSVVTTAVNGIKSVVTTVFNTIKSTVERIVRGLKLVVTTTFNGIKSAISTAMSGVTALITRPFELAKAGVQRAVDAIKSIAGSVGDLVSNLNPFAKGGIVMGPTPALIGEAGAEAVIPLTRPLAQVDPSVRAMAALIRGESQGGYAAIAAKGNTTNNTSAQNNTFNINDTTGNAEATAQKVLNRLTVGL